MLDGVNPTREPLVLPRLKLLVVSLAYPPLAYPRSIQVARLLKFLNAATVVACADEPAARKDATIEPDADKFPEACIRLPVRVSGWRRIVDRFAYRFNRRLWKRRMMSPDGYGEWKIDVLDEIDKFKRQNDHSPDAVVTFAQPFTDHLIGLELRNRYGLPWLAHFSDPWADNPFSSYDEFTRAINLDLERQVVESADILAFTSQETVDLVMSKYSTGLGKKARVLPQCFDPSLFAVRNIATGSPITIRYLGNFYGGRTAAPLVKAIAAIVKDDPKTLEDVRFELVGVNDAAMLGNAGHEKLPAGLLNVVPSVPYQESLSLMSDSDGLLIIDAPAKTSVFLPSKLIDYIGAGRPVMGITPPGTAAELINALGGTVADPLDITSVSSSLRGFVQTLRERRIGSSENTWGTPSVRARFEAARCCS